jgi:glycosyltransferase involved in cell wall biosynthesis
MKFSIVTPCFNSEKFIEKTINSVLQQSGNFEIEYIFVDGLSTDNTLEIIKKYKSLTDLGEGYRCNKVEIKYISEKDKGMYDAINKGFKMSSGDILAWINSDDYYNENAFNIISQAFNKYQDILWLKGYTSFADALGNITNEGFCYIYNQNWIQKGIYGRNAPFIHQDSVFWRRRLWQKIPGLNQNLRLAGDYDLWIQFSKYARLWSINFLVSVFRKRPEQLSSNMQKYREEQNTISKEKGLMNKIVKIYFWLYNSLPKYLSNLWIYSYILICSPKQRQYILINSKELVIKTAYSFFVK